jgi:hypothetical protein
MSDSVNLKYELVGIQKEALSACLCHIGICLSLPDIFRTFLTFVTIFTEFKAYRFYFDHKIRSHS